MAGLVESLRAVLTTPTFLITWVVVALFSTALLWYDLSRNNKQLPSLMKAVWTFTMLYSGPLGLAIYAYSGRKEIKQDSLWRRGFRSTAHCYSGCGAGEIVGVFIAAGVLSLTNWWIVGITFVLAYISSFALTDGPLMQDDVPFHQALKDAAYSETASIAVMEIVAIAVDLYLARGAKMHELLFWSSLVFSLTMGLLAAYPVNVLLIHFGVKEGMHSPKMGTTQS
jgi:hypothetical protein